MRTTKQEASQYLLSKYPTHTALMESTKATNLCALVSDKCTLYTTPCPTVNELGDVYGLFDVSQMFCRRCIDYIYTLKENARPDSQTETIAASNFLVVCGKETINKVLCFLAEYPSVRQFGKGFDYTHFASEFKRYCDTWEIEKNKIIESQIKKEKDNITYTGATGANALRICVAELLSRKVDVRQGGLYNCTAPMIRHIIESMIPDGFTPDINATERHYRFLERDNNLYERRRSLPEYVLTAEEISEYNGYMINETNPLL